MPGHEAFAGRRGFSPEFLAPEVAMRGYARAPSTEEQKALWRAAGFLRFREGTPGEEELEPPDEDAFKGIKHGRRNAKGEERMDAFGSDLTDPEITALVAYVRTFARR